MISANSRYANSQVVVATDLDNNDAQVIVPGIQISYTFSSFLYLVRDIDRLTDLAYEYLGDPTLWWLIADANPEYLTWDQLPVGKHIRIPVGGS